MGAPGQDPGQALVDTVRIAPTATPAVTQAIAQSPDHINDAHAFNFVKMASDAGQHLVAKSNFEQAHQAANDPNNIAAQWKNFAAANAAPKAPRAPSLWQDIENLPENALKFGESVGRGAWDFVKGAGHFVESVGQTAVRDTENFVNNPVHFLEQLPAHEWHNVAHWFDEGINTIPHLYRYTVEYAHKYGWAEALGHLTGTLLPGMLIGGGIGGGIGGLTDAASSAASLATGGLSDAVTALGRAAVSYAGKFNAGMGSAVTGDAAAAAEGAAGTSEAEAAAAEALAKENVARSGERETAPTEAERGRDRTHAFERMETVINKLHGNPERQMAVLNMIKEELGTHDGEPLEGRHIDEAVSKAVDHVWENPEKETYADSGAKESGDPSAWWHEPVGEMLDEIHGRAKSAMDESMPAEGHIPIEDKPSYDPLEGIADVKYAAAKAPLFKQIIRDSRILREVKGYIGEQMKGKNPTKETNAWDLARSLDSDTNPDLAALIREAAAMEQRIAGDKANLYKQVNPISQKWMEYAGRVVNPIAKTVKTVTAPVRFGSRLVTSPMGLGAQLSGITSTGGSAADHHLWQKTDDGAKWVDPFMGVHATMGQSIVALINHVIPGFTPVEGPLKSLVSGGIDFSSQFVMPDPLGAVGDIYHQAHSAEGVGGFIGKHLWNGLAIRNADDVDRLMGAGVGRGAGAFKKTIKWLATASEKQIGEALKGTGTSADLIARLASAHGEDQVLEVFRAEARKNELLAGDLRAPAAITVGAYTRFKSSYREWVDQFNRFDPELLTKQGYEESGLTPDVVRRKQMANSLMHMFAQKPWYLDSDVYHSVVRTFDIATADPQAIPAIIRMLRQAGENEKTLDAVYSELSQAARDGDATAFKNGALNAYVQVAENQVLWSLGKRVSTDEWELIRDQMRGTLTGLMQAIGLGATQIYTGGRDNLLDNQLVRYKVGGGDPTIYNAGESSGHLNKLHLMEPRDLKSFGRTFVKLYEGPNPAWNEIQAELRAQFTNVRDLEMTMKAGGVNYTANNLRLWLDSKGLDNKVFEGLKQQLQEMKAEGVNDIQALTRIRYASMQEREALDKRLYAGNYPKTPTGQLIKENDLFARHAHDAFLQQIAMKTAKKKEPLWHEYFDALGRTEKVGKDIRTVGRTDENVRNLRKAKEAFREAFQERTDMVNHSTGGWRTNGQVRIDTINDYINNMWFKPLALFSQAWAWHVAISETMLNIFRTGFFPYFESHFASQYAKKTALYGLEHAQEPGVKNMIRNAVGGSIMGINRAMVYNLMGAGEANRLISDAMDIHIMHPGGVHPALSAAHGGSSALIDSAGGRGGLDYGPYRLKPAYLTNKFKTYNNSEKEMPLIWLKYADAVLNDPEHIWIANRFRQELAFARSQEAARWEYAETFDHPEEPHPAREAHENRIDKINNHYDTLVAKQREKEGIRGAAIADERAVRRIEQERERMLEWADQQVEAGTLRTVQDRVTAAYHERLKSKPEAWRKQFARNEDLSRWADERNKALPAGVPRITPLEDWARVSVKTNMNHWTSLDTGGTKQFVEDEYPTPISKTMFLPETGPFPVDKPKEYTGPRTGKMERIEGSHPIVHHPYLLDQIVKGDLHPVEDISDYKKLVENWGKKFRGDVPGSSMFPSNIPGPEVEAGGRLKSMLSAMQELSEKGHVKYFGPFVDWMSRQPTFLWEYHQEMEQLRARIAGVQIEEHFLPTHLAMTPEEVRASLPDHLNNIERRTTQYLEEHPNHKVIQLGHEPISPANQKMLEDELDWLDKTFWESDGEFKPESVDPLIHGEHISSSGLDMLRIVVKSVLDPTYDDEGAQGFFAFDKEGHLAAALGYYNPGEIWGLKDNGRPLEDFSQEFDKYDTIHVGVLGSTGRAHGAATALQYNMARYAHEMGQSVNSHFATEAFGFHDSIGRIDYWHGIDDARVKAAEAKLPKEFQVDIGQYILDSEYDSTLPQSTPADPFGDAYERWRIIWDQSTPAEIKAKFDTLAQREAYEQERWRLLGQIDPRLKIPERYNRENLAYNPRPLGAETSTSVWFRYHVKEISELEIEKRLAAYTKARNEAMSSYGEFTSEQAKVIAQNRAAIKMLGYVHNPLEKTGLENALRIAAPFYFAQNQAWRRAIRLLSSDPGAFERYLKANLAISNYASTHQVNGIPMAAMPGSQLMGAGVGMLMSGGALGYGLAGNLSSTKSMTLSGLAGGKAGLQMLQEFLPQLGPVATVPIKAALGILQTGTRAAGNEKLVNQEGSFGDYLLGPMSANQPFMMDLIPSTLVRNIIQGLQTGITGDSGNVWGTSYASTRNQVLIELSQRFYNQNEARILREGMNGYTALQLLEMKITHPDEFYALAMMSFAQGFNDVNEYQHLMNTANRDTAILWTLKVLGSFTSPLSLSLENSGTAMSAKLVDYIKRYGATEGYSKFAAENPTDVSAVFMSVNPEGVVYPETNAAEQFFTQHADLMASGKYSSVLAYLIPRKKNEAFNSQAYATELQLGLRARNIMSNGSLQTPGIIQTIAINAGNNWYYNDLMFKADCYQGIDPTNPDNPNITPQRMAELDKQMLNLGMDPSTFGMYGGSTTGSTTVSNWVQQQVSLYGAHYNSIWGAYHSWNYQAHNAVHEYTQFSELFSSGTQYQALYNSMNAEQRKILADVSTMMQAYDQAVQEYAAAKAQSQPTSPIDNGWYDYLTNIAQSYPNLVPVVNTMFKHLSLKNPASGSNQVA